jgi:FMN phosphatase YigB (HAD superfamily)
MNLAELAKQAGFGAAYLLPVPQYDEWTRRRASGAFAPQTGWIEGDAAAAYPWANALLLLIWPYAPLPPDAVLSGYYPASNRSYHAMQTLRELKERGYYLLILSNCRIAYMEAHRKAFSLDEVIDDYYAAESYDFIPKEEIFLKIRERYPGDYVIIGDRDKDIRTALVHGLRSVGCTYGFAAPGELDAADIRIGDITELPGAIEQLRPASIKTGENPN